MDLPCLRQSLHFFLLGFIFGNILCDSRGFNIDFDFKDNGITYDVIFVGQEDVSLICRVVNVSEANVTLNSSSAYIINIYNSGGVSVAENDGVGECVEYNIANVAAIHGGTYRCSVKYFDPDEGMNETISSYLDVTVTDDEQTCFRNGTADVGYIKGDVLLLSCYCNNIPHCTWIQSEVGAREGQTIQHEISMVGQVSVLRAIIGPLHESDLTLRFDCAHGPTSDDRCSIGPASVSFNDAIRNTSLSFGLLPECPELLNRTTSSPIEAGVPVMPVDNENLQGNKNGEDGGITITSDIILYVTIATIILLLAFLVTLMTFIVILKRNKRAKTVQEPQNHLVDSNGVSKHTNLGYDSTDYALVAEKRIPPVQRVGSSADQLRHNDRNTAADISYRGSMTTDGVRNANQIHQNDVTLYGRSSDIPERNRYGSLATDQVHEADQFVHVDATEYGVLRAFRTSTYDDDLQLRSNDQGTPRMVIVDDY